MTWTGRKMPDYQGGGVSRPKPLGRTRDVSPKIGEIWSLDAAKVHAALGAAFASGCAILISPTSDGGALSVTLYAGEQRHRAYCSSSSELQEALDAVTDVAEAHTMGGPSKTQNGPLRAR